MTPNRELPFDRLKIDTYRHDSEQIRTELRRFGLRDSFEYTVSEMRQPFRPAQRERKLRVIIVVQCAAHETTAIVFGIEARALYHLISVTVQLKNA